MDIEKINKIENDITIYNKNQRFMKITLQLNRNKDKILLYKVWIVKGVTRFYKGNNLTFDIKWKLTRKCKTLNDAKEWVEAYEIYIKDNYN